MGLLLGCQGQCGCRARAFPLVPPSLLSAAVLRIPWRGQQHQRGHQSPGHSTCDTAHAQQLVPSPLPSPCPSAPFQCSPGSAVLCSVPSIPPSLPQHSAHPGGISLCQAPPGLLGNLCYFYQGPAWACQEFYLPKKLISEREKREALTGKMPGPPFSICLLMSFSKPKDNETQPFIDLETAPWAHADFLRHRREPLSLSIP